ncbi:GntR family transcriptional regulator [Lysobacter sp. GX 14042]|uniref:GntR family transcriptional regulator n=1 Tax=Lysobacter sp. GX 14042 TaxID=2907155 RepID=UPI001F2AA3CC|nr:GntR family transcriptional regulator [Lysobacter sp. GX 14042]MCE7032896.1 GntR family transcriptional regulator [Lysobacter sp. GX 14042]
MSANYSKSAFLYRQVRRGLQAGRYMPGQRIDPATLAEEFRTSPTPALFALYRLVGEGLVVDHARSGFYVPLLTEVAMRDLYDWMERLLLMACDSAPRPGTRVLPELESASTDDDVVKLTWKMFDAIAASTGQRSLHRAVKQANDQLAPIRRAKQSLLDDPLEELLLIARAWRARDMAALRRRLREYYGHRKTLVPQTVDLLNESSNRLH